MFRRNEDEEKNCRTLVFRCVGSASAEQVCNGYGTCAKTWFPDYGYACAGYGLGCTECADTVTGASCVENGIRACKPIEMQNY